MRGLCCQYVSNSSHNSNCVLFCILLSIIFYFLLCPHLHLSPITFAQSLTTMFYSIFYMCTIERWTAAYKKWTGSLARLETHVTESLMAAADIGSLWLCRSPPGHSAGNQKWDGPRACSSSTPAWSHRVRWGSCPGVAFDSPSPGHGSPPGWSSLKTRSQVKRGTAPGLTWLAHMSAGGSCIEPINIHMIPVVLRVVR